MNMNIRVPAPQVGAVDPERKTSPIADEFDEDYEVINQEVTESSGCYFNDTPYAHNEYVCSGSDLLQCNRGMWVLEGSCDPDNP
jgi:hypothetical protein